MRCIYCDKQVWTDGCTVPGKGPAHKVCHDVYQTNLMIFRGLRLSELSDSELQELDDMIRMEQNKRNPSDDDVELF